MTLRMFLSVYLPSSNGFVCHFIRSTMKRYSGNGAGGFRQPSFQDDEGYRRNAGRGSNMTQPAWQTRYQNGGGGDGSFGSFGNGRYGRHEGPSMTAPITEDEMSSPARDNKGKGRDIKNMFESGHNRPLVRSEIEAWINGQCEPSFSGNRQKVDTMVEFFMSSKSASSTFRYLQKVRGPKFFGTFSNYFVAFDNEMTTAGLHDFTDFMKDTLFPKSGERPLEELDMSIPDFIRSQQNENALIRQFRMKNDFCGGSAYYLDKIEQLREARRKKPEMKKQSTSSSSSSAMSSASAASTVDMTTDSPEMSKSDMVKMLKMQEKMLKKLVSAEAETASDAAGPASNTRSSEKSKKQKRTKD